MILYGINEAPPLSHSQKQLKSTKILSDEGGISPFFHSLKNKAPMLWLGLAVSVTTWTTFFSPISSMQLETHSKIYEPTILLQVINKLLTLQWVLKSLTPCIRHHLFSICHLDHHRIWEILQLIPFSAIGAIKVWVLPLSKRATMGLFPIWPVNLMVFKFGLLELACTDTTASSTLGISWLLSSSSPSSD